jgi:Tol biopolymer transport system component
MTRRTIYLPALIVAALLVACAAAVSAVSEKAEATFAGKNGKIAYEKNRVIYTVQPDGGGKTKVTSGTDPSYSPDGKKIVYVHFDGNDSEIYTVNANGGHRVQLTNNNNTYEHDPSYSPDGKKIVYMRFYKISQESNSRRSELYTIDVRTGRRVQLTNNNNTIEQDPSYSPNGKRIVYEGYTFSDRRSNDIYTINASGGHRVQLTTNNTYYDDYDPSYSPDGKRIVYYSFDKSLRNHPGDAEIYTMNAFDGGAKLKLTNDKDMDDTDPSYSPDGKRIAYTHFDPFRGVQQVIYTINAGGGGKVRGAHISGPCGGGPTSDCTFKETELSWGSRP